MEETKIDMGTSPVEKSETTLCITSTPSHRQMPCAKFLIAAGISVASFTVGIVMVIKAPNNPMTPFYASLITGAISFWVKPPSMNSKET